MSHNISDPNDTARSLINPNEFWQQERDDRLDAEYEALKRDARSHPEPDAGERERVKRLLFRATCRVCGYGNADGRLVIDGQCTECTNAWWDGAA